MSSRYTSSLKSKVQLTPQLNKEAKKREFELQKKAEKNAKFANIEQILLANNQNFYNRLSNNLLKKDPLKQSLGRKIKKMIGKLPNNDYTITPNTNNKKRLLLSEVYTDIQQLRQKNELLKAQRAANTAAALAQQAANNAALVQQINTNSSNTVNKAKTENPAAPSLINTLTGMVKNATEVATGALATTTQPTNLSQQNSNNNKLKQLVKNTSNEFKKLEAKIIELRGAVGLPAAGGSKKKKSKSKSKSKKSSKSKSRK